MRTNVQRYRCSGCKKTYSGRTGSAIGRIHRPDLFLVALYDMLSTAPPQSERKLARELGLNKHTVWRWRMLVLSIIAEKPTTVFSGILEADEVYQRESCKGSREWVRHLADPRGAPAPPRPRWVDFSKKDVKMKRGLSSWQLPILTVADRSGTFHFSRLADRKSRPLVRALEPLIPDDVVLCSDGTDGYAHFSARRGIEHFVLGSKAGTRVSAGCYHIQNINSLNGKHPA